MAHDGRMGTAVVTGAGQGLGRATAERLARDGHHVAAVDRDGAAARRTADAVGGDGYECDVTDAAAVDALAESIGPVEILVNNAGIWRFHDLQGGTLGDVDDVISVNLVGVVNCTRAFARTMESNGAIVNLSSNAAHGTPPGVGIYPATKAAVEAFTKQCALELGSRGIRVNAVGPGMIVTEGSAVNYEGERGEARARAVPIKRVGQPDDIANVIGFLTGPDAAYVSGQVIYVDGGLSAGVAIL